MAVYVYLVVLALTLTPLPSVLSTAPRTNFTDGMHIHLWNQVVVVRFEPRLTEGLVEDQTADIFYALESDSQSSQLVTLQVKSRDSHIATVETSPQFTIASNAGNDTGMGFISIRGHFLGRTVLTFSTVASSYAAGGLAPPTGSPGGAPGGTAPYTPTVIDMSGHPEASGVLDFEYHVSVIRERRIVDSIFLIAIVLIIVAANVGMGCKIDVQVIREVTRRPVAPAIGIACQYVVMPLLCFGLIKALGLQGGVALGMFATGCAPGGGASNIYAYLLRGDVALSVTMTFFSTMAALGLIPFWLFTLGRLILDEDSSSRIRIPYMNIIYSLLLILIPVGVGILIQRFKPVWSKYIIKALHPICCFFIIFVFTFGVYVNYFIFSLFTAELMIAGILLPYVGFLLGGIIALTCRQSWMRIKTIAVETGIQNTGVAFLIVTFTLPQPEADLALVSPVIVASFTPIPLLIGIAIYEYRSRCSKQPPNGNMDEDLQSPITEEATFDQLDKKNAMNGVNTTSSETPMNGVNDSKQLSTEYPLSA